MTRIIKNWKAYHLQLRTKINQWLLQIVQRRRDRLQIQRRKFYWERTAKSDKAALRTSANLSDEKKAEIRAFYEPYVKIRSVFHDFYYAATGRYDVRYIPDDIYYAYIDPYFNDWDEAHYLDNKTYYKYLFHDVPQPETIAFRCGGLWFDAEGVPVLFSDVVDRCLPEGEAFLKQATDSEGGSGVFCVKGRMEIEQAAAKICGDIIIQKTLKQHPDLSKLCADSVNTVRILSRLSESGVKIYSAVLRMGINGARVDNASSGGISAGICDDGRLKPAAYSLSGVKYDSHPSTGVLFDSVVVPSFSEATALVKEIHRRIPHFKLASWDVAIREDGVPVLVEMNIHYGELGFHQLNNGPLFGEDTEEILREVFRPERAENRQAESKS